MKGLQNRIIAAYEEGADLGSALPRLLSVQKKEWPELKKNYEQLANRQTRILSGAGSGRIVLQFNPTRIGSTLAKIDGRSLQQRKCFLCVENLPPEQKGYLYRGDYLVLCNPYPIFAEHFTISSISHRHQNIIDSLQDFFSLAADIAPGFTVFYNGPQCGASAPDHMHFQVCPSGVLPVESETMGVCAPVLKSADWTVHVAEATGRGIIAISAKERAAAAEAASRVISALGREHPLDPEPLLNIITRKDKDTFRIFIFPRRKFRPDCFYLEGDRKILVSPAAVELGGLIITPMKKDFDALDFDRAVSILKEVSLDSTSIIKLLTR